MANTTVLVVEDEGKIVAILRDYLSNAGFDVITLGRGDEVVAQVRRNPPHLIILDIMLPGMDGMEVCREIRKFSNLPIVMLTARVEEIDRLLGLELGADDYVCKPFSPREVVARVKAVLRRTRAEETESVLTAGPIQMIVANRQVTVSGESLRLTPSEFELLRAFLAQPERVFTRQELVDRVFGYEFGGYERTVDTHVKNLRRKFAEILPNDELIATVYGVGYRLNTSF